MDISIDEVTNALYEVLKEKQVPVKAVPAVFEALRYKIETLDAENVFCSSNRNSFNNF